MPAVPALEREGVPVHCLNGGAEYDLRSVRLAEAPSHGLPAIAYDRRSPGAEAYWKVAMELVDRA